jgi:hypothetical protein
VKVCSHVAVSLIGVRNTYQSSSRHTLMNESALSLITRRNSHQIIVLTPRVNPL